MKNLNYSLIGAAGYIAPRHMKAMNATGGTLVSAYDPSDSVGIIDSHFPDAPFFTDFENYSADVVNSKNSDQAIDYIGICSPNYLHDAHMRFGLRSGVDVICEKPLVVDPASLAGLYRVEKETGKKINCILQLRLHPAILDLKALVDSKPADEIFDVDLTYITSRGAWYQASWKGDERKSGGIATNIGVHFYDMLSFIFGDLQDSFVHFRSHDSAAGYLQFAKARVRWLLSINRNNLPANTPQGQTTYRSIAVNGDEIEFSGGFTDLHTQSYERVLAGDGFSLATVEPSIQLVSQIMKSPIDTSLGEKHPMLSNLTS